MNGIYEYLRGRLTGREIESTLRSLPKPSSLIDFCSNDYLGFARSSQLRLKVENELKKYETYPLGSTGSRLISGNSTFLENLEAFLAAFHRAEAGLIFNSGYDANLGLFSALPQRGDTIILDELAHASIIDGARLSNANRYSFKHNDLNSLREKLRLSKGRIYIGVESVYSMDGDEAPLQDIIELAEEFGAGVIVDEAHAAGIFGDCGRGLVSELNLEDRVFARLITFGKALGNHGAVVLGSGILRDFLINFARSFIYTTAAPFHAHLSVALAYELLQTSDCRRPLLSNIEFFRDTFSSLNSEFIVSRSPIQCLLIEGAERARSASGALQSKGFNVKAILHPTVPQGKERLRICLHSFNSIDEIKSLYETLNKIL